MKSAGKARNNGLYRHIRTSKEIIRNLLNDFSNSIQKVLSNKADQLRLFGIFFERNRRLATRRGMCYNTENSYPEVFYGKDRSICGKADCRCAVRRL